MSDELLIAIVAVGGLTLPVLITQITAILLSLSARSEARDARREATAKLDTIHEQTNSNLTEQKRLVQNLTDEVKALRTERDTKAGAEGAASPSDPVS